MSSSSSAPQYTIELNTNNRPTRFHVNPVGNEQKHNTDHDTDVYDEDTFNEDEVNLRNKRRSSRSEKKIYTNLHFY